ncbi:MAG: hypothetical protein OXR73_21720 [Myxococcales bacterium]|nr:hypothetical protein [Myxococcales bacterium]
MASSRISLWILAALLTCVAACSGDKERKDLDAGMDGGEPPVSGDGDGDRPTFEAGVQSTDAVPPCDPFEPDQCAAGQECDVVLRRSTRDENFDIYTGCVDLRNERGLGDPCLPWNDFDTPYDVTNLEVHTDPCEQGLVCAPDADVRGLFTCQVSCQSGRFQGFPRRSCDSALEFCAQVLASNPTPYLEYCVETDGCNPADPDACGAGRSCYLRSTFGNEGVQSLCLSAPTEEILIDDGEPCGSSAINSCGAGSLCWGPVRVPPRSWTSADVLCRPVCDPTAVDEGDPDDDDDAGMGTGDDDAGMEVGDSDGCPGDTKCVPFSESGLTLGTIDGAFGQCE